VSENTNPWVMVTGASGYIGGQVAKTFQERGYRVVGVDWRNIPGRDNFCNVHMKRNCDEQSVANMVRTLDIEIIVNTAGSSLVGPSVQDPAPYYVNNVGSMAKFVDNLNKVGWKGTFIFSSSASVYGEPVTEVIDEDHPKVPISPYGQTKWDGEVLLRDSAQAYGMKMIALRYFNACGADLAGAHGQEPNATHLVARICEEVLFGRELTVFGDSYPTKDGTCIRDYLHVQDIAEAHLAAIPIAREGELQSFNLGMGTGSSNLEVIQAFETAVGQKVNFKFGPIREGDPSTLISNTDKFKTATGWQPKHSDLATIVRSAWLWYNSDTYNRLRG
jgi:UDP-glucose 4-epimerase